MIRRLLRAFLWGLAFLAVVWGGLAAWSGSRPPVAPHPFFAAPAPNMAHRGGNVEAPEATLPAFRAAVEVGADVLEFDVHLTADDVPVVIHDPTVDRTTDGTGRVDSMTLEELREWSAAPPGAAKIPVPTLREVLEAHPGRRMVIEMKTPETMAPLCAELRAADRTAITLAAAFDGGLLCRFRSHCPETPTVASMSEVALFLLASRLYLSGLVEIEGKALLVPERLGFVRVVTPRFLAAARRRGLPVVVWTVNDPEDMERLLDLGAGGVLTDDPGALARILERRGRG